MRNGSLTRCSKLVSPPTTPGTLLNAYARRSDPVGAQRVFDQMLETGVTPDDIAWGTLLNAYGTDAVSAQQIFDQMVKADITPDEIAWTRLVNAYAYSNQADGAQQIFDQMVKADITPDEIAWGTLLIAYGNDATGAQRVFDQMPADITPNRHLAHVDERLRLRQ